MDLGDGYTGKARSNACRWSAVSDQPEAAQLASVRATLSDLGMAMIPGWSATQLSATCAGVLPAACAISASVSGPRPIPRVRRNRPPLPPPTSVPSASGE